MINVTRKFPTSWFLCTRVTGRKNGGVALTKHLTGRYVQHLPIALREEENLHRSKEHNKSQSLFAQPRLHIADLPAISKQTSPKRQRETLREWMKEQLNKGTFPGVEWVDRGARTFKIPWLHQAKRTWNSNDALIFKAWSQHTGVYKPKDTDALLKTRLRCALTKSRNIEHVETSSDDEDCFRIYRFKPTKELHHPKTSLLHIEKDNYIQDMEISDAPVQVTKIDPVLQIYEVQEGHSCFSHLHAQGGGEAAPTVIYKESPLYTVIGPVHEENAAIVPHSAMATETQPLHLQTHAVGDHVTVSHAEAKPATGSHSGRWDYFTIELYHNDKKVASRPFREGKTCRLIEKEDETLTDRNVLLMPKWGLQNSTDVSAEEADSLFRHVAGGVELELDNGNLYATNSCPGPVFYSSVLRYLHSLPIKMGERVQIFSRIEFAEMLDTLSKKHTSELQCEVYLGFGEHWNFCDGDESMPPVAAKVKSSQAEEKKNRKLMECS